MPFEEAQLAEFLVDNLHHSLRNLLVFQPLAKLLFDRVLVILFQAQFFFDDLYIY
jgi:hypothetical protein